MPYAYDNRLSETIRKMPMVPAAAATAAGVILFDRLSVPALVAWALFIPAFVLFITERKRQSTASFAGLVAALFALGGISATLHKKEFPIPFNRQLTVTMELDDIPALSGRSLYSAPVTVISFSDGRSTKNISCRAMLWSDVPLPVTIGDRLTAHSDLRKFHDVRGTYTELMARRGFAGTLFVRTADILRIERGAAPRTLHQTAVERLELLDLPQNSAAVAGAMSAGDRRLVTAELREAYSRSGTSHILAVSGLHIGIVLLLSNAMFRFLTIFRHGQAAMRLAVLAPIWLYSAASGFSPSVLRAAVMFSIMQFASAFSASYISLNTLSAATFIILCFDPDALFDISFQLSFAAVFAIITVGKPLFRIARRTGPLQRILWDTFIIGLVSAVATAPLTARFFGYLSPASLLINPLIILCAYIIIPTAVIWMVAPSPLIKPVVETLLDFTATLQNSAVERMSGYGWMSFNVTLSSAGAAMLLLLMAGAIAALWWWKREFFEDDFRE